MALTREEELAAALAVIEAADDAPFSYGFSVGFDTPVIDPPHVGEAGGLLSLTQVKDLLGITTDEYDDALEMAILAVTAMFENYLGRGLAYVEDMIEETVPGRTLTLNRFPIEVVSEITIDGQADVVDSWRIHATRGQLSRCDRGGLWHYWHNCCCHHCEAQVFVTYSGGYRQDSVPSDLANAFALTCAKYIGYSVSGSGSTGGAGIKSLGLGSGALTIGFDTASTSTGLTGGYDVSNVPPLLQPVAGTLQAYMAYDWGLA